MLSAICLDFIELSVLLLIKFISLLDKWEMYSSENEAFIETSSEEQRLINAMRRGADMRVSAVSQRGTATSYVISLRGVSAALDRVAQECN